MQDLETRVLSSAVVSRLAGVRPRVLARWAAMGFPAGRRAGAGYSWADVDAVQRVAHLMSTQDLRLREALDVLKRERAAAPAPPRMLARPNAGSRRRVVPVALPRSAKRRPRRSTR